MGLNTIMKIFLPKNKVFYDLFEKVADNVGKMGRMLKDVVAEPDFDKRAALITQLEDLEHANDELTHTVFTELGRNFITPIDREDIHYLASSLDDIADYIYASAKKINFYRVNPNDTGMQKMAELIEQSAQQVKLAVLEFSSPVIPGLRGLFGFYFTKILPRLGGMVSGSRGAYEYLPDSVSKFPDQKGLTTLMNAAGFQSIDSTHLPGGIAAIHVGVKPGW